MYFLGEYLPIFGIQDIVDEEEFQVLVQGFWHVEEQHKSESHEESVFLRLSIETSLVQTKPSMGFTVVVLESVKSLLKC